MASLESGGSHSAELDRLTEQVQKTYLETSQEVEAVSQELKSTEAEEITIADMIETSNQRLLPPTTKSRRLRR